MLLLLLSCGHASIHCDEGVPTSKVDQWLWTCIECQAEDQKAVRVLAALSTNEVESMTDEQFGALVERAMETAGR